MPFTDASGDDDIQYEPLGDEKSLLEYPEADTAQRQSGWSRPLLGVYALTLILLGLSVMLNIVERRRFSKLHESCNNHPTEEYDSPVDREVKIQYHQQFINGSFEKMNMYRQKAGKEADDAWLALGTNDGSILVSVNEAAQFGIKQGQVQRVAEQGGGYMTDIFVFHHLHCLNLMRQTSHWSWDHYRAKAGTDEAPGTAFENFEGEDQLETHFTHCLDILRQEVMCTANTAIYGQWYVRDAGPTMDFNFNRQCKNFDDIREWYAENHVDMDHTYVRYRPGDVVLDEVP